MIEEKLSIMIHGTTGLRVANKALFYYSCYEADQTRDYLTQQIKHILLRGRKIFISIKQNHFLMHCFKSMLQKRTSGLKRDLEHHINYQSNDRNLYIRLCLVKKLREE